jgi:hypothetical protein
MWTMTMTIFLIRILSSLLDSRYCPPPITELIHVWNRGAAAKASFVPWARTSGLWLRPDMTDLTHLINRTGSLQFRGLVKLVVMIFLAHEAVCMMNTTWKAPGKGE